MIDTANFRHQAERCRRLACGLDAQTRGALEAMAEEYDAKAADLAKVVTSAAKA
jgi:hypothetical protein